MGIIATARQQFRADLAAFRAANPTATRAQVRRYVSSLVDAGQEWLSKRDAQDAAAAAGFAASKPTQFSAYEATLPDVELGADPADPP